MVVSISQPAYLPWLGYFDLIAGSDVFVFLDHVQFEKQSWQSRNRLKGSNGEPFWLSVPVKVAKLETPIAQVALAQRPDTWRRKHLKSIRMALGKSPFFDALFPQLEEWLREEHGTLADLNISGIERMALLLGIDTRMVRSSTLPVEGRKVDLVLSILHELGATQYRANEGSRDYTEAERHRFEQAGINVVYQQWEHPVYPQPHGPFLSHLAFPDPVCNLGLRKASALLGMEKNSAL